MAQQKPSEPSRPADISLVQELPKQERTEHGQVIVAAGAVRPGTSKAPLPRAPFANDFVKLQEEYLEANGWELTGRNELGIGVWRDPLCAGSHRGVRQQIHVNDPKCPDGLLPQKDGPAQPLMQVVCPPTRWDATTEQAVTIQRRRDELGKPDGAVTPLERIDRQGKRIADLIGADARVAGELESLLKRAIPERPENLRTELTLLRRAIATAAQRLRPPVTEEAA